MAGKDDLVLKVSADTSQVASGLQPMQTALDGMVTDIQKAEHELQTLDALDVRPEIEISIHQQAIDNAKTEIKTLRDKIAENVVLGVDTKDFEKRVRDLAGTVRALEKDMEKKVDIDVEVKNEEEELRGLEALRSGALSAGDAFGHLDGSAESLGGIAREIVPFLGDLNETMVDIRGRAEEAGHGMGRFGSIISGLTGVMAGPWGIAIAAGVGLLSAFASSSDDAKDSTDDLTDSINTQAGAFDEANRKSIAKKLEDKGLLELAQRLGISTRDLVSATLGDAEAKRNIMGIEAQRLETLKEFNAQQQQNAGSRQTEKDLQDFAAGYEALAGSVSGAADKQARMNQAVGESTTAMDGAASSAKDSAGAVSDGASAWDEYSSKISEAQSHLDGLISSLGIFNGQFANAQEATINFQEKLRGLKEAVDDVDKSQKSNLTTFNLSNEQQAKSATLITDAAKSLEQMTSARLADAHGNQAAINSILTDYQKQRTSLQDTADKLGLSKTAAKQYIDKLLETPDELKSKVEVTNVKESEQQVDHFTRDRTIDVELMPYIDPTKVRSQISSVQSIIDAHAISFNSYTPPTTVPPPVSVSPHIYLDSRPIAAVMSTQVQVMVNGAVRATTEGGRL